MSTLRGDGFQKGALRKRLDWAGDAVGIMEVCSTQQRWSPPGVQPGGVPPSPSGYGRAMTPVEWILLVIVAVVLLALLLRR